MDLPYSVVSFLDEGDFSDEDDDLTSEVPTTWLTPDKNECWWPKCTDVNTYIAKRKSPVEGSRKWSLYRVKVEGYYENLEKARSAAADKKSESESSSSQNQPDKPYLRKRKQQLSGIRENSADGEDSGDSDDNLPKTIAEPPKLSWKKKPPASTSSPAVDSRVADLPKSPAQKKDSHRPLHSQINLNEPQEMLSNPGLPLRNQKKNNNVSRVDIQSLPIEFEDHFALPGSPIRVQRNDTSLPSHSRTVHGSPIDLEINDSDFNLDIATAGLVSSGRSIHNSRPMASNTTQLFPRHSIEETSLLFEGSITDLCDGSNTKQVINEKFSKLIGVMGEMLVTLKSVDQRLTAIEDKINVNGSVRPRQDFKIVTGNLPFKNNQDIQIFEGKLAADDFRKIFVQYVGQIGGTNAKENILRILRRVFANSVAKNASWCGLRNNLRLSELRVIAAIREGVRGKNSCTDKEFEDVVSEWFRQGNQRFKRETVKNNPPQQHAIHNGAE